jgi:IPT/TIG domain
MRLIIIILEGILLMLLLASCEGGSDPVPAKKMEVSVKFGDVSKKAFITNVTLSSKMIVSGELSEVGFLFGEVPGLTIAASEKIQAPVTTESPFSVEVNNLVAGKQYYARPFAIAEGKEFTGPEINFITTLPTYTDVTPLTAGRGNPVTIHGNFITNTVNDIQITFGGTPAVITSYTSSTLVFRIPDDAVIGAESAISLTVGGHNLGVSETIMVTPL